MKLAQLFAQNANPPFYTSTGHRHICTLAGGQAAPVYEYSAGSVRASFSIELSFVAVVGLSPVYGWPITLSLFSVLLSEVRPSHRVWSHAHVLTDMWVTSAVADPGILERGAR